MTTKREHELYRYTPSLVPAVMCAVTFGLLTTYHVVQVIRTRTWFFIPFVIGGIFEMVGYIARAVSHSDKNALMPYLLQSLFLLVAPSLYAASIYMTLGRVISLVNGQDHCLISLKWVAKIFVAGDILAFFMQGGGGGQMVSKNPTMVKAGEKLILVGLFFQIVVFGFFCVVAVVFNVRIRRSPTAASSSLLSNPAKANWQYLLYTLYATSGFILIRSLFRVAEYMQGRDGALLGSEFYLLAFDAALMIHVMMAFNWIHPGGVVPGRDGGSGGAKTRIVSGDGLGEVEMQRNA